MFGGRFGQIRFGLGKLDLDILMQAYLLEHMENMSSFGENIPLESSLSERLGGNSILTLADPFSADLEETIQAQAQMETLLLISGTLLENIGAVASLLKDIWCSIGLVCQIAHEAYLCKDIQTKELAVGKIDGQVQLAKDIFQQLELTEMVGSMVTTNILEQETILLPGITLPPGSTLYIDTERFLVLLDSRNALYLHKGDWPTLHRGIVSMDIDTGVVGQLEGKLIYNERYL